MLLSNHATEMKYTRMGVERQLMKLKIAAALLIMDSPATDLL
jgi:hypothetical protein